jgi:hypothetical protein
LDVGELVGLPDLKIFILLSFILFISLFFFISILFECLNSFVQSFYGISCFLIFSDSGLDSVLVLCSIDPFPGCAGVDGSRSRHHLDKDVYKPTVNSFIIMIRFNLHAFKAIDKIYTLPAYRSLISTVLPVSQ